MCICVPCYESTKYWHYYYSTTIIIFYVKKINTEIGFLFIRLFVNRLFKTWQQSFGRNSISFHSTRKFETKSVVYWNWLNVDVDLILKHSFSHLQKTVQGINVNIVLKTFVFFLFITLYTTLTHIRLFLLIVLFKFRIGTVYRKNINFYNNDKPFGKKNHTYQINY